MISNRLELDALDRELAACTRRSTVTVRTSRPALVTLVFAAALIGISPRSEAAQPQIDFDNQVIPILTKAGCNTGACHGAAVGRGGLRMSLYGGDPAFDFETIALELEGRRVNLARPADSLIVLKATESINHGGGYRLEYEGEAARLLEEWVGQGAVRIQARRLQRLDVRPTTHVLAAVGEQVTLQATAHFSDGSRSDVTKWTVFTPEDAAAVTVDSESAVAQVRRRGRHIVIARYLSEVVPIELLVPLADDPISTVNQPRYNFIDQHVLDLLTTLRIPISEQAADETFLRRVTLDLTGRLPTEAARRAYVQSRDKDKRKALVDRLLNSDEFTEYWTLKLATLLRLRSQPGENQGALTYHGWLKEQLAAGRPYDAFVRELLLATGDSHEIGPANFYRTVGGPREQAEFASELLMGSRLRCANCHNHPLDRWTQDDYHGLAAIFAKVQQGRIVKIAERGEVSHPKTGEAAIPRIPGERFLDPQTDGRKKLADWLTDRSNPYFAQAIVNRLWKSLMGRGLVEPTDDLRATNPATHPQLLNELASDFAQHNYDLRHTLRRIALSAAYSRSPQTTAANQADDRFYSHAIVRPLPPEVLADAISDLTGVADQYGDQPLGTRAVSLFDPKTESAALDILGRCSREDSCETPTESTGGLTRKLHLLNGSLLNRRLTSSENRLAKRLEAGHKPTEIVDEFYRLALTRQPTPDEQKFWSQQLQNSESPQHQRQILEDFVWSLLSCREFVTNH